MKQYLLWLYILWYISMLYVCIYIYIVYGYMSVTSWSYINIPDTVLCIGEDETIFYSSFLISINKFSNIISYNYIKPV